MNVSDLVKFSNHFSTGENPKPLYEANSVGQRAGFYQTVVEH